MAHLYPQVLLALLIVISECRGNSPESVSASQEEDAVLRCFNSTEIDPNSCYRVRLIKYATDGTEEKVIFAWPKKLQNGNHVKWGVDEDGKMCLSMTKPQKCDEGLYGCEIYQGWDCTVVHNISLKVKDCKTIQGVKAAPGTLVELNCPVQIMAAQNISWAMLKGGNPVSITSTMFKMNDTLLAIHSVNVSDSGWYRCMYMLEQTQHCFDINLLVQVESVKPTTTGTQTQQVLTTTENVVGPSGAFITTVVLVVLGTLIVAVLTGLFIYCRCNTHRVRQQTQRDPAGVVQLFDGYETVDGVLSEDFLTRRNNTLYQDDGSISTFRY